MSDPFEVPSKQAELTNFIGAGTGFVAACAAPFFVPMSGQNLLVFAGLIAWTLLWLFKGMRERSARLPKLHEVERLKTRLMETR